MNGTDQVKVETRECPECGTEIRTPVDTRHVWCPCEPRGVPFFSKGTAQWRSVNEDGGNR